MTHHDWSDKTFDWKGLNEAINIVHDYSLKYGRLGIHCKEKWGNAQITPCFFDGSLHSLLYPGYVYCQYMSKWYGLGNLLWWCDIYLFPKISKYTGLHYLIYSWQKKVYNWAFQKALKGREHIRDEILCDIDCHELVDGATEVHNRYWKSYS